MFVTRYFKGRPRGLPQGTEIYVCEARYNEDKHQFNKIKTWASCLPDEVRDRDYEMDLYDQPKKMKKFPSPIKFLLNDQQKETDDLPKVTWGADGAPPRVGAVHRRHRTDRDSLPPEPTPPPPPVRMRSPPRSELATMSNTQQSQSLPRAVGTQFKNSYGAAPTRYGTTGTPTMQRPGITPNTYSPLTPSNTTRPPLAQSSSNLGSSAAQNTSYATRPNMTQNSSYREPPAIEVYVLPDQANLSIPADVREQYRQDHHGRILFFTAPPLAPPASNSDSNLRGHSVRYLAAKARRAEAISLKRKELEEKKEEQRQAVKKARMEQSEQFSGEISSLKIRAIQVLADQLQYATKEELSDDELARLKAVQDERTQKQQELEKYDQLKASQQKVKLVNDVYLDDYDNRITA